MVITLAGRRLDAPHAEHSRFPPENVPEVAKRIQTVFNEYKPEGLVCSAACGADLLALTCADQLGIRCRVVLPFTKEVFRKTSVIDCPGNWGAIYDRITNKAHRQGDLVLLGYDKGNECAYTAANVAILDEGAKLAQKDRQPVLAVVVWNGTSHGEGDVTGAFLREAKRRSICIMEVSTV